MASRSEKPVPVPFAIRARHLLANYLQGTLFFVTTSAAVFLWARQSPRVIVSGQVQSIQVVVPAARDGILKSTDQPLMRFDRVEKNVTAVAQFDVSRGDASNADPHRGKRKASSRIHKAEQERLRRDRLQWDWQVAQQGRQLEQQRLDRQRAEMSAKQRVDTLVGDLADLEQQESQLTLKREETDATLRQGKLESAMLAEEKRRVERLVELKMSSADTVIQIGRRLDLLRQSLADAGQLKLLVDEQLDALRPKKASAIRRLDDAKAPAATPSPFDSLPTSELALDVDSQAILEPFRQAISVQDSRIRELAQQIADSPDGRADHRNDYPDPSSPGELCPQRGTDLDDRIRREPLGRCVSG